jgi:hypothetical protein
MSFLTLEAAQTVQAVCGTATALTYTLTGMELTVATGVESYKVLAQGQVANSAGVLYTATGVVAFVDRLILANTTGSAITGVIVYVGGTAAGNQISGSFTIPANGAAIFDSAGLQVYDANGNLFSTGPAFATPAIALGSAAAAGVVATGIRSDATIQAFDATLPAVTVPLSLTGVVGSAGLAARRDHQHQSPGAIAAIIATSGAINTVETLIVSGSLPANFIQAGTVFRVTIYGTCTSSAANVTHHRIRLGTAGNNTDTALGDLTTTAATTGTAIPFRVEFLITFRNASSSTGISEVGGILIDPGANGVANAASVALAPVNTTGLNTAQQQILQYSYQTASLTTTTCTFQLAVIEVVKM